jgi:hypothetical protein
METEIDKQARFEKLVAEHDLTYNYSDDGSVWRRGQAQRDEIVALAKELPEADVIRIWDAKVDRTLVESVRKDWYWRPTKNG